MHKAVRHAVGMPHLGCTYGTLYGMESDIGATNRQSLWDTLRYVIILLLINASPFLNVHKRTENVHKRTFFYVLYFINY